MPTLPTIDITDQTKYNRVVDAFQGGTQAETVANYRSWLKDALRHEVLRREMQPLYAEAEQRAQAKVAEIEVLL